MNRKVKKGGERGVVIDVKGMGWMLCLKCVVEDDREKERYGFPIMQILGLYFE